MLPSYENRRQHLEAVRQAALQAADPGDAVRNHLSVSGRSVGADDYAFDLRPSGRLFIVAVGKAAPAMAAAADELLKHLEPVGVVTVPGSTDTTSGQLSAGLRRVTTEHPLPGPGSIRAGRLAKQLLAGTAPDDLVVVLISGGGSAMIELPKAGIRLSDLQATNRLLLASGMPITKVNLIRKALSQIKAGGLARMAAPARVLSLILSDVVGDSLGSVASGPTDAAGAIVDGSTYPRAIELGRSPKEHLEQNNAYPVLDATSSLIRIGPTGTNLNDVVVGMKYRIAGAG